VFIGDAVWDARAPSGPGITCIGVLTGGSSREELTGAGAVAVYDGPADLLEQFPDRLTVATPG
jgi:phosphoglycolate phosphatase-like HAD superfamily hydrolase